MDNHPNVNALLDTLEAALSEDAESDGIETGFRETSPEGESQYLFLNRQSFDYGHMLDDNQNPIRPPARCIAGRVEDVSHFTRTSDQYSDSHKLRLRVETDGGTIMIETGFFTNTAKSLLSDLAEIENPNSILTIEPTLPDERRSGNSQNVLFTDLYEGTEAVISQRYPDTDQDVIDTFKEVRQDVFGLPAQEEDPPRLPNNSGGQQGGGGAPPRQHLNGGGQQRRQGGQQRQQQPRQQQPRQASNGQPRQASNGQRNGRQPQQGGQPQQGTHQDGQQQPNQAPPSRDGTAQTPNTPPHTA